MKLKKWKGGSSCELGAFNDEYIVLYRQFLIGAGDFSKPPYSLMFLIGLRNWVLRNPRHDVSIAWHGFCVGGFSKPPYSLMFLTGLRNWVLRNPWRDVSIAWHGLCRRFLKTDALGILKNNLPRRYTVFFTNKCTATHWRPTAIHHFYDHKSVWAVRWVADRYRNFINIELTIVQCILSWNCRTDA